MNWFFQIDNLLAATDNLCQKMRSFLSSPSSLIYLIFPLAWSLLRFSQGMECPFWLVVKTLYLDLGLLMILTPSKWNGARNLGKRQVPHAFTFCDISFWNSFSKRSWHYHPWQKLSWPVSFLFCYNRLSSLLIIQVQI